MNTTELNSLKPKHDYTFEFQDRKNYYNFQPIIGQVIGINIRSVAPFPIPGVNGKFMSNLDTPVQLKIGLPFIAKGGWEKYQGIATFLGHYYHCIVSFAHYSGGVFNLIDSEG